MKKITVMLLSVVTMGMMLVSCGSGSENGGTSAKSGKVFGKLVSVMQDAEKRAGDLEAKSKDCNDVECLGKIMKEAEKQKASYEENLKKAIEDLIGVEISTQVKDLPVKVTKQASVTKMNSFKRPNCDMELELTQDITVNDRKEAMDYIMLISFIDSEGNSLTNKGVGMFGDYKVEYGKVIPAGTKFNHSFDVPINKKNLDKWQNFEKVVLEKKPNI